MAIVEAAPAPSALDQVLPGYDVAARHSIHVNAAPEAVYRAVQTTDLGRPPLVRLLMGLRAVPVLLSHPVAAWARLRGDRPALSVRAIAGYEFAILAERPEEEIVLGIVGRFWRPSGCTVPTNAVLFAQPLPRGLARAAWNISVVRESDGTRLATETRVECADEGARRSFLRYWRIVGPFSGMLRNAMLESIRRTAEAR